MEPKPRVFLAFPNYGQAEFGATVAFIGATMDRDLVKGTCSRSNSLLPFNFNIAWAQALTGARQGKYTHFAMIHSDIVAPVGWLDTLLAELHRFKADVVSSVIQIKNHLKYEGLTSTAIGDPEGVWKPVCRLSMKQVVAMPDTFNARMIDVPDRPLLINTGLWVCDLRREYWHAKNPDGSLKFCFDFLNKIDDRNGEYFPDVRSEDWLLGQYLYDCGRSDYVYATRKVKVDHMGKGSFSNNVAYENMLAQDDYYLAQCKERGIEPFLEGPDKKEEASEAACELVSQ